MKKLPDAFIDEARWIFIPQKCVFDETKFNRILIGIHVMACAHNIHIARQHQNTEMRKFTLKYGITE